MSSQQSAGKGFSRRDFLKISGVTYMVAAVGCESAPEEQIEPVMPQARDVDLSKLKVPPSQAYLLVDTKKCQGCLTCMLACSLAQEGQENLSLSRIQVVQNPFEKFSKDITLEQCRQCLEPSCMDNCPTGALHVNTEQGNIRTINAEQCRGCFSCVESCSQPSSRIMWDPEEQRAIKCDLCASTPHWKEAGGPAGKQLCVEVCPVGAIKLVKHIPQQEGEAGYDVNLRGPNWGALGYTVD